MPNATLPALLSILAASAVFAQNEGSPPGESDVGGTAPATAEPTLTLSESPDPAGEGRVRISPYIWLTSISGDIGVRNVEFDATQSFVDILDNSDTVFGLMGAVDVEYGRVVFEFDAAWTMAEVTKASAAFGNASLGADVDINSAWFELFGGYRVVDNPFTLDIPDDSRLSFDVFGGGRVTAASVNSTLRASTSLTLPDGRPIGPGVERDLDRSAEWFEPFVGARVVLDLTDRWTITLRGDVGGFGVDNSEFAWQAQAIAGYRWELEGGSELGVFAGYRAIGQDYERDNFKWDLVTHGPVLGAALSIPF